MNVGDIVVHPTHPEYGTGKVVSLQAKMGTVLVKFEKNDKYTYHLPWLLDKK